MQILRENLPKRTYFFFHLRGFTLTSLPYTRTDTHISLTSLSSHLLTTHTHTHTHTLT